METTLSSPKNVKLILSGFDGVIREGLIAILSKDKSIEVVGVFENGHEALTQMYGAVSQGRRIDVVLTETRGGHADGIQVTRMLTESFPHISVLVLSEYDNDSNVIDAIHAGAGGFLFLTELQSEVLIQSIHRVMQGGFQIRTDLLRRAVDDLINNGRKTLAERTAEGAHLSQREVDVLRLMGNGDANKEIASALTISVDTVKKHVQSVISKLGARSRTHASIIAAKAGILAASSKCAAAADASHSSAINMPSTRSTENAANGPPSVCMSCLIEFGAGYSARARSASRNVPATNPSVGRRMSPRSRPRLRNVV